MPFPPRFETRTASYRANPEDRLLVVDAGLAWIVCVADGTGGISGGSGAAETCVAKVEQAARQPTFEPTSPDVWCSLLVDIDGTISRSANPGETTGVVVALTPTEIVGASCGDSQAWLFSEDGRHELTRDQSRKPRLGSGRATPQSFRAKPRGVMVVATDGLFDYAKLDDIARTVLADATTAADELVQALVDRHRALPDDVAIVIAHLD